jgi:hypothetical protein
VRGGCQRLLGVSASRHKDFKTRIVHSKSTKRSHRGQIIGEGRPSY